MKINLKLSKLKPLHSEWLVKLYHEMQSKGDLIRKGFDKAGITDALNMDYLMPENPFDDEDMLNSVILIYCNNGVFIFYLPVI